MVQGSNDLPGSIDAPGADEEVFTLSGVVKWFDPAKGYGFAISESGEGDILIHLSCLKAAGVSSAREGATIECEVVRRFERVAGVETNRNR